MTFVDANVFMYAVGRPHPLKSRARDFLDEANLNSHPLCTSAEVLQELMHAYLPVGRAGTLAVALDLVHRARVEVWPLEKEDVLLARELHEQYPVLAVRDLCHLASCRRRGVSELKTFDVMLEKVGAEVLGNG